MKLKSFFIVGCMALLLSVSGCASEETVPLPQLEKMEKGEDVAVMTTNYGVIKMRLFPEYAPKTVENFTTLSKNGYYNGLTFHRVIDGFMIQGGDPEGDGTGGESMWGEPFEHEVTPSLHHISGAVAMANSGKDTNGSQFYIVENDKLDENSLALIEKMKKDPDMEIGKNTEGIPVYVKDLFPKSILDEYADAGGAPHLDLGIITENVVTQQNFGAGYTVFGQVFEGMDVVHEIASVEKGETDKPVEDVIIEKIEIVPYEG